MKIPFQAPLFIKDQLLRLVRPPSQTIITNISPVIQECTYFISAGLDAPSSTILITLCFSTYGLDVLVRKFRYEFFHIAARLQNKVAHCGLKSLTHYRIVQFVK